MARCIAWLFTFHGVLSAIWCLTLDPHPTVAVTRYNSQSFICSVESTWSSVAYYHDQNIAFFLPDQDGKCQDEATPTQGLYTTYCNDSTRTFYLTINNVTADYNGKPIACIQVNSAGNRIQINSLIYVQYQPTASPTITQTPVGPIIEGNKVTLTCAIQGGNPVATITWSCDGATQITPTKSPTTVEAISSVELVLSQNNNGQICTCTGRHILWSDDKTEQHTITVYYEPISTPYIIQTPPGPINESSTVILTCDIKGGNPLATITWTCEGLSTINPTGSPPRIATTSSVQLTVNSDNNGRICTCIGHHPVWTTDKTTSHTLDVRYQPIALPTITQTPDGPIIEGNKVTLTCTIQGGNPIAKITWSCDAATEITPTGSPSTVDAISSVDFVTSKNNNGQICTCTGRHLLWTKDKTQEHNITVYYSPTVSIMNMDPLEVVENVTLKLVCQVMDANPIVNSFSWYKRSSTTPIGMESIFSISNVSREHSGEYRCEGSNGIGQNGNDTVYVNVLYNPEITHLSVIDGNEIVENDTAIIRCNVESNPLSKVEWTFEKKTLYQGNLGVLQSNYTIQRAKCLDTGFYICTATNIINMESYSDKRVVQLSVKCYPRRDIMFDLPENQIGLALGQHLKMQIHIIAYPPAVVEWRFRSADNSTTKIVSSNCNQTNMFKHTACFEKDKVTEDDFGQYSIFVHNGLGSNFSYLFNVDPQGGASESNSVITIAAGTGSAAAALIIGVVVVIVVLRKRMANAKGNENSDNKGRLNMTPMDEDEVVEGLQENVCYVSAGPHFRPIDAGAANYEAVERKDQSDANDVKQDSQETALYSIVDKKSSAKGKTTSGEKTKENFTNQGSSDNQKQNVNKNGLQYADVVFNPLPNGSKFKIHGLEDKTIYAEVDTTQKIDPLPESDDEDKGNKT